MPEHAADVSTAPGVPNVPAGQIVRGPPPVQKRALTPPLVHRTHTGSGVAGVATLAGVALLGVVAGLLLDRLLDFDDALDAGGEWDEGGGVFTRWQ